MILRHETPHGRSSDEKVTEIVMFGRTFSLSLALWIAWGQPGYFVPETAAGDEIVVYRESLDRDGGSRNWKSSTSR